MSIKRVLVNGYRIFSSFDFRPESGLNILAGHNEAGKSTLLEAISLALTGRQNGRPAQEELNPYWFNQEVVRCFFRSIELGQGVEVRPPEILIELYLESDLPDVQLLRGVYNSLREDSPGLRMHIAPSDEYASEISNYFADRESPRILPTEWYRVDWKDFRDETLTRRPKCLGVSVIDSRTVRSRTGIDYHTREMLGEYLEVKERASIAVAHRSARHAISVNTLGPINSRIVEERRGLVFDQDVSLQMDQSSQSSWEESVIPHVADVPFTLSGQGQQAAIKVALAMSRNAARTAFALVEEPENHLSHTSLTKLISRIGELSGERQTFLTTHSSYVLNRLGLDKLALLYRGSLSSFSDLPQDTVEYFKRLSGYDSMRLVLAEKLVLVEGPSDEMVMERAFRDFNDQKRPVDLGIDIVSMSGVSLKRGLQLCATLNRKVAAVRDNDNQDPDHWREPLRPWLEDGVREVFIGNKDGGSTLEYQFAAVNDLQILREIFGISEKKAVVEWMLSNKTEWAWKLDSSSVTVRYPQYILDAIEFLR